jgi:DNA-binding MarR family transcriptional regulator
MLSHEAEVWRRFTNAVFSAHAALLRHGDAATSAFGQSSARWRVLARIADGEATVADIARLTGYTRQAVQRLADALAADGLIRQQADESDRRKQRLELTGPGAVTFERMEAHFDVWAERLLAHIPEADLASLSAALDHIRLIVLADRDYMKRTTGDTE